MPRPQLPTSQRHSSDRYFDAHELDVYPRLRQPLFSDFDPLAVAASSDGRLLVMVTLDATGKLDDISIVEREGDRALESRLREALQRAGFFPAEKDGNAVRSRLLMSIDWSAGGRPLAGVQ